MDPITFHNPECEFDNFEKNQSQFAGGTGANFFEHFSHYWNDYTQDSIQNQIWVDIRFRNAGLSFEKRLEFITNTLDHEHDSNNNINFFVTIQMELNGLRYTNNLVDQDVNTPGWETNDACYYRINHFDIDYVADCLDEKLLAIQLDFEGKLYAYNFVTKIDSIDVRGENINLLFARN